MQSCPSSQFVASVVPGMVIGAVVVAPNVVMGCVEVIGVVGGAAVVMSDDRKQQLTQGPKNLFRTSNLGVGVPAGLW